MAKNLGLYLVLIVLVVSLVNMFLAPVQGPEQVRTISYSEFLSAVEAGKVRSVQIQGDVVHGRYSDGTEFKSYTIGVGDIAKDIAAKGVNVEVMPPERSPWWAAMMSSLFPTLLLIGAWIFILYHMQGGGSKVMSFAKSKAKLFIDNRPKGHLRGCRWLR